VPVVDELDVEEPGVDELDVEELGAEGGADAGAAAVVSVLAAGALDSVEVDSEPESEVDSLLLAA